MKKFEFRGWKNCVLSVEHYNKERAIAIEIVNLDTDNVIAPLTILDKDFDYEVGTATICAEFLDGDNVFGYKTGTDILNNLGVVEDVIDTYMCRDYSEEITKVDVCVLNLNRLKEISKDWEYYEY